MKILFIGDVFGLTGCRAISTILPNLKKERKIDFVIANAENTTNCKGLSNNDYNLLMENGIDFFTMGNHTWNNNEIFNLLSTKKNIIRPSNLDPKNEFSKYGTGSKVIYINNISIRITSLLGLSVNFKNQQLNPFIELENIIKYNDKSDFHIVDFHAESTAEKNALFYEFNGKVSAILGTHTHIQTADNKIKNNTAFITDIGSTGPADGVIGAKGNLVVDKFKNLTNNFIIQEAIGKFQFCAVILELDEQSKIVKNIERIFICEQ